MCVYVCVAIWHNHTAYLIPINHIYLAMYVCVRVRMCGDLAMYVCVRMCGDLALDP